MRPTRPSSAERTGDRAHAAGSSPWLAALGLTAALALTATACGPGDSNADSKPTASAAAAGDADKLQIPDDVKTTAQEARDRPGQVEERRVEELGQGQLAA